MINIIDVERLKNEDVIPSDSKVISTHNNLIISSEREQIVSRLAHRATIEAREDPGDLVYSHKISWMMGANAGVVAPLSPEPTLFEDIVISSYPKHDLVDWDKVSANNMYNALQQFHAFAPEQLILRTADVTGYAQARIERATNLQLASPQDVEHVRNALSAYLHAYPFTQLVDNDPSLVHGDLQTSNVVSTPNDAPLLIDLDSVAIGPRLSDLASWHVRNARGDKAPTYEMIGIARRQLNWNEESFCALMGWKVISSMTHTIRFGEKSTQHSTLNELTHIARKIGAAGKWSLLDGAA